MVRRKLKIELDRNSCDATSMPSPKLVDRLVEPMAIKSPALDLMMELEQKFAAPDFLTTEDKKLPFRWTLIGVFLGSSAFWAGVWALLR